MKNKLIFEDGSKVFFTSDLHFGHKKIIEYCDRPFKTAEEMNEKLIENWNATVSKDGIVFILGDVCFKGISLFRDCVSKLNGTKYLIIGNHDHEFVYKYDNVLNELFIDFDYQKQIEIEGRTVYLNHYPFLCYGGEHRGEKAVWQLHGHVHSKPGCTGIDIDRLTLAKPTQLDVGVDNWDYKPVSWKQINETITEQVLSNGLWMKSFSKYGRSE